MSHKKNKLIKSTKFRKKILFLSFILIIVACSIMFYFGGIEYNSNQPLNPHTRHNLDVKQIILITISCLILISNFLMFIILNIRLFKKNITKK